MIDIEKITLRQGNHSAPERKTEEAEACAMEWVSVLAGERWSDHPQCTDLYIASFVRNWNDAIQDDARRTELLRPMLPLLVGTRGSDALMLRRVWMGIDWDIRVRAVAFLRLVPALAECADAIAALPEIRCQSDLSDAHATLQEARMRADAARAAARDAARAAARDAAWAAARDAARDAAWDAAWAAAWDAAWAAARDAAWAAAWDAAGSRLAPVVAEMQVSAQDLIRRMCALTEDAARV